LKTPGTRVSLDFKAEVHAASSVSGRLAGFSAGEGKQVEAVNKYGFARKNLRTAGILNSLGAQETGKEGIISLFRWFTEDINGIKSVDSRELSKVKPVESLQRCSPSGYKKTISG
jgi:hypothetical protein